MADIERERGKGKFIGAAQDELEVLEKEILEAESNAEKFGGSDPEAAAAWQEIAVLAMKRKELFMAEHDQAGAFKLKKFDRQVRDFFFANEREGRKQVIERGEDEMYKLAEGQENRRLLFVDMLELARLNKEGGSHDAGDTALEATVENIKRTVQACLEAKKSKERFRFDIFRSGGNQFMVSFDGVSEKDFNEIAATLSQSTAGIKQEQGEAPVEAAPLVVSKMKFEDLVEDLNVLQEGMSDRFTPGADAGREVMSALLRGAEWRSDVGKFVKYAERVVEKLGKDPKDATVYFNEYVKKYFAGTRFEKLEDIKALIDSGDVDQVIREEALTSVRAKFDTDRKFEGKELDHLDEGMRKVIISERIKARWRGPIESDVTPNDRATESQQTEGEMILAQKKATYLKAESDYKLLLASAGPASIEAEKLRLQLENAKLDLQIETARRNVGTGLLERGVYYEDLESKLEKDEDVTSVFVDMGFLKYFDEDGGRDVGDRALLTAARLMEKAVKETGLMGEVYRYGGDEFAVLLKGGKADAAKFEATLTELKKKTGVIPRGPKSKAAYVPTELQFNVGVANQDDLKDTLAASGRQGASANRKAEILTKAADVAVKYRKAVDRFDYLVDQLRRQPGGEMTPDIRAKLDRSAKVTAPDKEGELLIRTFADEIRLSTQLPVSEREVIFQEIQERSTTFILNDMEEKYLKEKEGKRFLDQFIDAKTKADFLESELAKMAKSSHADKLTIKDIKNRLNVAQMELDQMRNVRGSLAA